MSQAVPVIQTMTYKELDTWRKRLGVDMKLWIRVSGVSKSTLRTLALGVPGHPGTLLLLETALRLIEASQKG